MIDRAYMVTTWLADRYMLGFAPAPRIRLRQILCRLCQSPSDETINRGHPWAKKKEEEERNHTRALKVLRSVPEFRGLRKRPNNPAGNKSVGVFTVLKLDTIQKKREREKEKEKKGEEEEEEHASNKEFGESHQGPW